MEKEILKVIQYFDFFDYPPTFDEIYTFLGKKTTKKRIEEILEILKREKKIKRVKDLNNVTRYTLHVIHKDTVGEYGIKKSKIKNQKSKIEKYNERYLFSQEKLKNWRFRLYIKLLSFFPQIKLIGLSGSLAMMNANRDDDIDLFIITAKKRLFTGRFLAIILAKLLKIHRGFDNKKRRKNSVIPSFDSEDRDLLNIPLKKVQADINDNKRFKFHITRYPNKICLNLFFDESDLIVPEFKRNEYVAHEILQMKPIINKDQIYERFLEANSWVFEIFPNSKLNIKYQISKLHIKNQNHLNNFGFLIFTLRFGGQVFYFLFFILNFLALGIENMLKGFQMYFINKHKTTEFITSTQLWFHPEDFYKKIQRLIRIKKRIDIE